MGHEKGDVVILGLKGQSGGAAGHTFMAVDGTNAIDCAWYGSTTVNAVRVRNENVQPYSMGLMFIELKLIILKSRLNHLNQKLTSLISFKVVGILKKLHLNLIQVINL